MSNDDYQNDLTTTTGETSLEADDSFLSEKVERIKLEKARSLRRLIALVGVDNVVKMKDAGFDVVVDGIYLLDNHLYNLVNRAEEDDE